MDPRTMRRLVESARVGRLATVGVDGVPHLVPIVFVLLDDVLYSAVDHKPKRGSRLRRFDNVRATGRACVLVDAYDEDWTALWWVRLDGRRRGLDDPSEACRALTALAGKDRHHARPPPAGPRRPA